MKRCKHNNTYGVQGTIAEDSFTEVEQMIAGRDFARHGAKNFARHCID